jgi:predicted PurR-regulated permease PerM
MKKLIYVALSFFLLIGSVNVASATVKNDQPLTEQQQAQLQKITNRVDEIRDMDKSNLTREQKRVLRTELRTMKTQANAISNGGIYLSITAILVIILLLLILR